MHVYSERVIHPKMAYATHPLGTFSIGRMLPLFFLGILNEHSIFPAARPMGQIIMARQLFWLRLQRFIRTTETKIVHRLYGGIGDEY